MKKRGIGESLLSPGRSGRTGEERALLHAGAKQRATDDSGYMVLPMRNKRLKPLCMNVGTNSVEVRVTAEDGTTTKTYTIAVDKGILVPDEFATIQSAIDATAETQY